MTKARTLADNFAADINGITAGTGITGGGTSGTVTITNDMATTIDAKGDLVVGTGADTYDNLAAGANGETLVADSSTSTGLRWQGSQAAGKNYIINGGMDIWQRGTSFTTSGAYSADRWYLNIDGASAGTASQITSSLPTGFRYGMKLQRTAGNTGTGGIGIGQSFETSTSIPLAGQTVIFSFWAKAGANFSGANLQYRVGYGTGTDQAMANAYGGWTGYSESQGSFNLTTSWVRYTAIASVPSNTTQISVRTFYTPSGTAGADDSYSITGHQLELGSVATPFTRAGGTLAGELAACQRYYWRSNSGLTYTALSNVGTAISTTQAIVTLPQKVSLRATPTVIDYGNLGLSADGLASAAIAVSAAAFSNANVTSAEVQNILVTATGLTQYRPYALYANNNTAGYIAIGAEL